MAFHVCVCGGGGVFDQSWTLELNSKVQNTQTQT